MKLTASEEDYILEIGRIAQPVRTTEIALALKVAPPSVSVMIAKLIRKGLLRRVEKKLMELTSSGDRIYIKLLRRHRLIELFLTDILNYGWDEVHEEAHNLEHLVSDKVIVRIEELLEHPTHDPHGQQIPAWNGIVQTTARKKLTELKPGRMAIVSEVNDHDPELLRFLGKAGVLPGVKLQVTEVEPFGGSVIVLIDEIERRIGIKAATQVKVESL